MKRLSVRRAPITEREFMAQVIQYAKLRGFLVAHFRPAMTKSGRWVTAVQADGKGFPDLVLVKEGRKVIFAELKVGKNPTSADQRRWLDLLAAVGGNVVSVVWTPKSWDVIERMLT